MINFTILNHYQFRDYCLSNGIDDWNVEDRKGQAFISIVNTDDVIKNVMDGEEIKHYFSREHYNVCNLTFDDVSEDIECDGYKATAMSSEQAKQLFDFIEDRIADGTTEFIIHCYAGKSRSQAVGRYIHDMYGGEGDLLEYCNIAVLTLLKRKYYEYKTL